MAVEMMDIAELKARFPKGSRVQLHPATDDWMRGDRYGEVVGYGKAREYIGPSNTHYRQRPVLVKLDKSGKTKRHSPHNLFSVDRDEDDKAMRKNPRRDAANASNVRELILYADNTYSLQNQYHSIILNLLRKYAAGRYDPSRAGKLWKYWFDSAAQSYTKEHGGSGHGTYGSFSAADREQAGNEYARGITAMLERGEFDEMLMKLGGIHAKRLAALRAGVKANPKARDPAHRKLLKKLDTHFAADEQDNRAQLAQMQHAAYLSGDAEGFKHYSKALRKKNPSKGGTGKTPYQRMKDAGVEMDSHATDLYVPANETTRAIIAGLKADGWIISDKVFVDNIDKKPWIELPFYYEPAWRKNPRKRAKKNPGAWVIASTLHNGTPLTFDGDNRFTDSRKPNLYRTRTAAEDKLALLRKHFKGNDTLNRAYVREAQGDETGAVFGARPRTNPRGRGAHTFEVWYPGYQTKVRADSAIEAARMAYGGAVTHVSGTAMGQNPAIYTAADGAGTTIKVWKSRADNPQARTPKKIDDAATFAIEYLSAGRHPGEIVGHLSAKGLTPGEIRRAFAVPGVAVSERAQRAAFKENNLPFPKA